MLGTPDYIAPEQSLDAQKADIRADIYSLGCTLYYLLSGGPPFSGSSLYAVVQAHRSMEATPLNLLRPEVALELAAVVGKMMAKDPARRYQAPAAVAKALKPFFKLGEVGADVPKPELSRVDRPIAKQRAMHSEPTPALQGPTWEGLIDLSQRDSRQDAVPASAPLAAVSEPKWQGHRDNSKALARLNLLGPMTGWVAAGCLLLGIVVYSATGRGTVRIANTPPAPSTPTSSSGREPAKAAENPPPRAAANPPVSVAPAKPSVSYHPEYLTTRVGQIRLKLIPPGRFRMGSPKGEGDDEEHPQHEVRITRPFYLGVTEVTRGQFRRFVDDAGYKTEAESDGKGGYGYNEEGRWVQDLKFTWLNPGFEQTDEHPVVNVSWNDAQAFISWLSRNEGKTYPCRPRRNGNMPVGPVR
jgi:serine/threonine protein kinase